jgi:hypothetical protein
VLKKEVIKILNKLDFKILYFVKDGEVGVAINGIKYIYYLDAGLISKIIKTSKRAPGKALAFLKGAAHSYERR